MRRAATFPGWTRLHEVARKTHEAMTEKRILSMGTMQTLTYTVPVLTPAFLGDAEQNGRWRYGLLPTSMRDL